MATCETGGKLMCKSTLYAMHAQQLTLFRHCELYDDLAACCSRAANLLRQGAAFYKLARASVIELGIRPTGNILGCLNGEGAVR